MGYTLNKIPTFTAWEKIDSTYILLNNASVAHGGKITVSDTISGKMLLSYPDGSFANDIAVSDVRVSYHCKNFKIIIGEHWLQSS